MTDTKPVPPTGSAEGETAALQAQVIDARTMDQEDVKKDTTQDNTTIAAAKSGSDEGMVNYLVSSTLVVQVRID